MCLKINGENLTQCIKRFTFIFNLLIIFAKFKRYTTHPMGLGEADTEVLHDDEGDERVLVVELFMELSSASMESLSVRQVQV